MLNENLLQLVVDAGELLELDETVVEKDYYVTQAIQALSGFENEYFRLVFAGGTCLAKAHKIVMRMSEDIDFKIEFKNIEDISKSRMLKELKQFRSLISSKLEIGGLIASPPVVRNEGKYSRIDLSYFSAFSANSHLRPHILIEFSVSEIRLPIDSLSIKTLIEECFTHVSLFSPSSTPCISACETGVEKWVGLTRRIVAIERTYHCDDATLIRHVYDLNAILKKNKINDDFFTSVKRVVENDAKQFKNQHPEYSSNPSSEIRESLALLKSKPLWKDRYNNFIEAMVYDKSNIPSYEFAIQSIENLSEKVIHTLV